MFDWVLNAPLRNVGYVGYFWIRNMFKAKARDTRITSKNVILLYSLCILKKALPRGFQMKADQLRRKNPSLFINIAHVLEGMGLISN